MPTVEVTREIEIAARPGAVWITLSTPGQQPRIEPRVCLVSEWGTPGTVDSGYELAMRRRPTLRLTVTHAIPEELHVTAIDLNGRRSGWQEARLTPSEAGTLLAYTFAFQVPTGMGWIQRTYASKQLARWLASVARVSSSQDVPSWSRHNSASRDERGHNRAMASEHQHLVTLVSELVAAGNSVRTDFQPSQGGLWCQLAAPLDPSICASAVQQSEWLQFDAEDDSMFCRHCWTIVYGGAHDFRPS